MSEVEPFAFLTIASIDEPSIIVKAQYNPKEFQIDQNVPWKKPEAATKTGQQGGGGGGGGSGGGGGGGGGGGDPLEVEFTGAEGRSVSVELLFDGYEMRHDPDRSVDVQGMVQLLTQLATVRKPESKLENERRPHQCLISWGAGIPSFQCVIESLSTKYTMFSRGGRPLRATCTVKLKEAKIKKGK